MSSKTTQMNFKSAVGTNKVSNVAQATNITSSSSVAVGGSNTTNSTVTSQTESLKKNLSVDVPIKKHKGSGFINSIIHNNAADRIYIADKDSKIVTEMCIKEYKIIGIYRGHAGTISCLGIDSSDQILISGGADRTLRFYNIQNGSQIFCFEEDQIPGYPKQIAVCNNILIVYFELFSSKVNSHMVFYDLNTLTSENIQIIKSVTYEPANKPSIVKWFDDSKIMIGFIDGTIVIQDYLDDSLEKKSFKHHLGPIRSLAINKNKNIILSGSQDCTAKLTQINPDGTFQITREFTITTPVTSAIFSYNERKVILTGSIEAVNVAFNKNNDFTIKFFGIKEDKLINQITSHFGPVKQLIKLPNSKNIITGGIDSFVKICLMDLVVEPGSKSKAQETTNETINTVINDVTNDVTNEVTNDVTNDITDELINETQEEKQKESIQYYEHNNPSVLMAEFGENAICLSNEIKQLEYVNTKINVLPPEPKPINIDIEIKEIEEEVNKTTVRVTGLPENITYDQLRDLFDSHGMIEEERGIKILDGRDGTYAYIKYVYEESAARAIEKKHGFKYQYQVLHVELAKRK